MKKIMFVCHGNICRSPMAEFVMKHLANEAGREHDFVIASSATSTEEIGNGIYPPAKSALRANGIPFDEHYARQIKKSEYDEWDIFVCMDDYNVKNLLRIFGSDERGKIRKLLEYVGEDRGVADPWYTGDFSKTYRDVLAGCKKILEVE